MAAFWPVNKSQMLISIATTSTMHVMTIIAERAAKKLHEATPGAGAVFLKCRTVPVRVPAPHRVHAPHRVLVPHNVTMLG